MYTIAIDLGGTVVKIGLLSDGEIVDCVRLPSRLALGLALNLPKIRRRSIGCWPLGVLMWRRFVVSAWLFPGW